MIKNIIFDLGRVILNHRKYFMYEVFAKAFSLSLEKAKKIWHENKDLLVIGKETEEEFFTRLKKELTTKYTVWEIKQMWRKSYENEAKDINTDILNLIEKLKKTYKVYLLTDTVGLHDEFNSRRNIYSRFDRVFKSYVEKVKKPDKKAYMNVLDKIEAKAQECVFIDDLEDNVRAAEKIGMKGIVYNNFKQLKDELKKFEVKI